MVDILMSSQKQLSMKRIPDHIEEPKTGKQRLKNSITFLTEKKCLWYGSDEVFLVGENFANALTDALWTINGHHYVFSNQSIAIDHQFSEICGLQ